MNKCSFFISLFGMTMAFPGLVLFCNVLIDPFGEHNVISIHGINQFKKPGLTRVKSEHKAELAELKPQSLILGTSRVRQLSVKHSKWTDLPVYNLSFAGSNIRSLFERLKSAHEVAPLKTVVMGLDFFTFLLSPADISALSSVPVIRKKTDADFQYDPNYLFRKLFGQYIPPIFQRNNFSFNTLSLSFETVRRQVEFERFNITTTPYRRYLKFLESANKDFASRSWDARYVDGKSPLEVFVNLVKFCRQNQISLHLFFSPVHSTLFEVIIRRGFEERYRDWKKSVAEIVLQESSTVSGTSEISIWNFSNFHGFFSELLDRKGSMTWFDDPGHYGVRIGNIIIDSILSESDSVSVAGEIFGTRITPQNLSSIFQREQTRMATFRGRNQHTLDSLIHEVERNASDIY